MKKEKILVVDDEEDILELVRYNLAREATRWLARLPGRRPLRRPNPKQWI
ncbi:hypothetical protein [Desulfosarcina cetonica]|nr:hypothetical protein [Desulfosarcina cetonica]